MKKLSILRRVEVQVKNIKTLEEAKQITLDCIANSKINKECKDRMINDISRINSLTKFLTWFYNDILAFEDCRVVK